VRGWGLGGEMTQALYAHMNNKTIIKKKGLWHFIGCKLPESRVVFLVK
jgi:hypothetical protein